MSVIIKKKEKIPLYYICIFR